MRVLVACEYSGRVRDSFLRKGHNAWSCDILDTDVEGPHIQGDVRDVLSENWDLVIGFPPCTDLSWANGKLIHEKRKNGLAKLATDFAELVYNSGTVSAIENPARSDLQYWRKSSQIIQPWQFGDPYIKTTGLWLRGLPLLDTLVKEEPADLNYWISVGARNRKHGSGITRGSKDRAKMFPGIAQAMADQWSGL